MTMKIQPIGEENTKLTEIFRAQLASRGYIAPEFYVWHNGEPLYHGEPIQGRWSPAEAESASITLGYYLMSRYGRMVTR